MQDEGDESPSLLEAAAEQVEGRLRLGSHSHGTKTGGDKNGNTPLQLYQDVFEVMLSLIHSATTLQEQVDHLQGMAQWLLDEADRFQAAGKGTQLVRSSTMRH